MLRHLEGRSFEEVAARMGRTGGAVRMLWLRALERLEGMLEAPRCRLLPPATRLPSRARMKKSSACSMRFWPIGSRPADPRELLAWHPAIAHRLRICLAGLELLDSAAQARQAVANVLGDYALGREIGRGLRGRARSAATP